MIRRLRIGALALALAATPACVSLTPLNPAAAARSADQQAYALIGAYALVLDEAATIVRDPATPRGVKTALARAEAAATPAVELVKVAAVAYRRAETEETSTALSRAIAEAGAGGGAGCFVEKVRAPMHGFIIQVQLLLAALSAVLPLAPANNRAQLAHVLETIAAALKLGQTAVDAGESLASKFAALRGEVEHMAALSAHASPDELETAFERVRSASAAFRSAYAESATTSLSLPG